MQRIVNHSGKNGRKMPQLNTVMLFVLLAAMSWVGTSLLQLSKDVTQLQAITSTKATQLDRIESDLTRHREVIAEMQRDIAVMKSKR